MTTYNTGNPIGSKDPRDLYDNSENLDTAVNDVANDTWNDRFGRSRKTMSGMERQFDVGETYRESMFAYNQNRFNAFMASGGYQFLGDYEAGIEITEYNQIVRDSNGEFWRLSGQVELPYTTTGAEMPEGGNFVAVGDAAIRQEFQELGFITPTTFGAPIGGVTNATAELQAAIDALPDGGVLDLLGNTYRIQKGAPHAAYPNGDQPCLVVHEKKGVTIRNGTLLVKEHGLGAIDFNLCENVKAENLTCVGAGNFPPLDGTTGRAEKGDWLSREGDFTTKPHSDFEGYFDRSLHWNVVTRNNSVDSSSYSTGGFGGNFPQWGGGTASTWGMWNGGYIGNFGHGITFIDCTNSVADGCNVSLFNGSGLYTRGGVSTHVKNCHIHGNYIGGVEVYASSPERADLVTVTNNTIENNGHPQASISHNHIDPGYGFSINNGTKPPRRAEVKGNTFIGNKRKGAEAHSFDNILVEGNNISTTGYGIQLSNSSGFVGGSAIITGNTVHDIDYGLHTRGSGISFNSSEGDVIISQNHLTGIGSPVAHIRDEYSYGILVSAANKAVIEGNTVENSAGMRADAAISVGQAQAHIIRASTISANIVRGYFLQGIIQASNTSSASYSDGNLINLENLAGLSQSGMFGQYGSTGSNLINIPRDGTNNKFSRHTLTYRVHATVNFPELTVTDVHIDGVLLSQPLQYSASAIPQGFVLHIDPRLNTGTKDPHVRFVSSRVLTGNSGDPAVTAIVYRDASGPNSTLSFTLLSSATGSLFTGSSVTGKISLSMIV